MLKCQLITAGITNNNYKKVNISIYIIISVFLHIFIYCSILRYSNFGPTLDRRSWRKLDRLFSTSLCNQPNAGPALNRRKLNLGIECRSDVGQLDRPMPGCQCWTSLLNVTRGWCSIANSRIPRLGRRWFFHHTRVVPTSRIRQKMLPRDWPDRKTIADPGLVSDCWLLSISRASHLGVWPTIGSRASADRLQHPTRAGPMVNSYMGTDYLRVMPTYLCLST